MSRQVCRDFQRGSCRFGTRCKFLHSTGSSQQRPQHNAFDTGPKKTQQQGFGTNRFGALNSAPKAFDNQRTSQQQPAPAKDHKCNNPKVCQDQIKEDASTEQPTYWRLTSYGHWKYLPNDISGDISPEELRALAYDSDKQGLPMQQIIQKEQSLVAAKNAEFEFLQRNPYRGPVTQASGGFQQGQPQPSPFTSSTQSGTFSGFGTPQKQSAAPAGGFGQPQTIFGVPITASSQAGGGFSNAFNKTSTNPKLSSSPFQTSGFGQSSQFGQSGFGTQSPVSKNIFGSQVQTPFGNGDSGFGGGFSAQTPVQPASTMNPVGFGSSPFITPSGFGSSPFTTPSGFGTSPFAALAVPSAPAVNPQPSVPAVITPATFNTLPTGSLPSHSVQTIVGVDGVWQKETWKLGEIPEEEPPESIRY